MSKSQMRMLLAVLLTILTSAAATSYSQTNDVDDQVAASPKEGWSALPSPDQDHESTTRKVLLWVPNRIADFFDIFRVDVGVGPAAGAVVRVTKYGQIGYRQMLPASVRVGLMGRRIPVMIEHGNEMGAGPLFLQSPQRKVCPGELGVGVDLFIAGAYAGICVDELFDFVAGIFTFDPKNDDFH